MISISNNQNFHLVSKLLPNKWVKNVFQKMKWKKYKIIASIFLLELQGDES